MAGNTEDAAAALSAGLRCEFPNPAVAHIGYVDVPVAIYGNGAGEVGGDIAGAKVEGVAIFIAELRQILAAWAKDLDATIAGVQHVVPAIERSIHRHGKDHLAI